MLESNEPILEALKPLLEVEEAHLVRIELKTRFRGITNREAVLFRGPAGWAEFSPFIEYQPKEASAWLKSAIEYATLPYPLELRQEIAINATIPVVEPVKAIEIVEKSKARTAKVKVADANSTHGEDCERIEAVRQALGPGGKIRIDANMAWEVDEAVKKLADLAQASGGLEYAEQPVRSIAQLAALRQRTKVLIAADESVRKAEDPLAVANAKAADLLVLKVQPLGGIRQCLKIAKAVSLPVVFSSALETSIGLSAGLAAAAAVTELDYACGLATASLLTQDVVKQPLIASSGTLNPGRLEIDYNNLQAVISHERSHFWAKRISAAAQYLSWPLA